MEQYQKIGNDLLTAVEKVNESLGIRPMVDAEPSERENTRSLAELERMMGGIR